MKGALNSVELTPAAATRPIVLIADDDDSLRRVLEFQLREGGYDVLSAADGLAALEIFYRARSGVPRDGFAYAESLWH